MRPGEENTYTNDKRTPGMTLLESAAFGVGVAAAAVVLVTLVVTVVSSQWRFWPPGEKSWKYRLHWGCVAVFNVALVATAVLDWNTWILPRPTTLVVGAVLALVGLAVFVVSVRSFERHETMGLAGDLHTTGPYARSRNPQYVGMIVGLVGFALLVNSLLVSVLVVLHVSWVLLLPFAEEPWLREEFGEEYRQYREEVPRFVGVETFKVG